MGPSIREKAKTNNAKYGGQGAKSAIKMGAFFNPFIHHPNGYMGATDLNDKYIHANGGVNSNLSSTVITATIPTK